jgi:hypothetical protein
VIGREMRCCPAAEERELFAGDLSVGTYVLDPDVDIRPDIVRKGGDRRFLFPPSSASRRLS